MGEQAPEDLWLFGYGYAIHLSVLTTCHLPTADNGVLQDP